mmetsp:Transcript_7039/g.19194  ORF Transcript_7039/g.19194 Transcript_7039/m.19194 type:complete len:573 (-) Transcript_7039:691-2409(-)
MTWISFFVALVISYRTSREKYSIQNNLEHLFKNLPSWIPLRNQETRSSDEPVQKNSIVLVVISCDETGTRPALLQIRSNVAREPEHAREIAATDDDHSCCERLSVPGGYDIPGLDFSRFMASCFIVMGHLYQSGRTNHPVFRYGFTWVPYYFMMSGYVLTLSAMKREAKTRRIPDFGPRYLQARLRSMYPIYLAAIFLSISTTWFLFGQNRLPENTDFLCHISLVQAWSPGMVERGLINMVHTWFLSALLFYWLLFGKIYNLITHKISSDLMVCALAGVLILPGFIYHIIVNQFDPWWYKDHRYMRESKFTDVAVLSLKYHPFAYLHIFVFGCCLPRVQRHAHQYRLLRLFISHGATCALFAIFLLFSFIGNIVPSFKISLRLGLLVPLHGLLLLGLSSKEDIVTYIFGMPILILYGASYGYPQYVMQTIVVNWVDSFRDKQKIISYEYNILLLSACILAFHAMRSINTFLAHSKKWSNIFLFGVTVMLASYIVLQKPLVATSTSSDHSIQGIHNDILIDFANQTYPPVMEGSSEQYSLINPSLLRFSHECFSTTGDRNRLFFAAREPPRHL